jgi:hypothetical protein
MGLMGPQYRWAALIYLTSSTPKTNPQGSHPSLAPFPINNGNFAHGLLPNPASG